MTRWIRFVLMGSLIVVAEASSAHAGYGFDGLCGPGGILWFPLMLIALAAGYGVMSVSREQPRPLDLLGRLIGAFICLAVVLSFLAAAFLAFRCRWCGDAAASCPVYHHLSAGLPPASSGDGPTPTPPPGSR